MANSSHTKIGTFRGECVLQVVIMPIPRLTSIWSLIRQSDDDQGGFIPQYRSGLVLCVYPRQQVLTSGRQQEITTSLWVAHPVCHSHGNTRPNRACNCLKSLARGGLLITQIVFSGM